MKSLAALLTVVSGAAYAGPTSVLLPAPTLDRWMYPFNGTPGTELEAKTFGAILIPGFDDRDGQFLIGYDTQDLVIPGQGVDEYRVHAARLRVTVSRSDLFVYDPTPDPLASSYDVNDPDYVPDPDDGKPIELYPVGYRNGYALKGDGQETFTFEETSEFGGPPLVPPAEEARNCFAAAVDEDGNATDVSRQVRLKFEAPAWATGTAEGVNAGDPVQEGTHFYFELDVCDPIVQAYLRRGLDAGRINLIVTSLHPVSGPGELDYPHLYTRENPIAQALGYEAQLELSLVTGRPGDFNNDGALNLFDFLAFQTAFGESSLDADYSGDCRLNLFDFLAFQTAFGRG